MKRPISHDDSMILCTQSLQARWQRSLLLWQQLQQSQPSNRVQRVIRRCPYRIRSNRQKTMVLSLPSTPMAHMPRIIDPYQLLQVRRDANKAEIRQAYRRLALWHHPGRTASGISSACYHPIADDDHQAHPQQQLEEDLDRRRQMFGMLAAAYETLSDPDARRRCNVLLREPQQNTVSTEEEAPPTPVQSSSSIMEDDDAQESLAATTGCASAFALDPASSARMSPQTTTPSLAEISSSDSEEEEQHEEETKDETTALIAISNPPEQQQVQRCDQTCRFVLDCARGASSASSGDYSIFPLPSLLPGTSPTTVSQRRAAARAERHYTQTDTDRLFGGPLQLLFRARRWRPFTDPYVVFESVFGSPLGPPSPRTTKSPHSPSSTPWHALERTPLSPRCGETTMARQQSDGSLLITRSRLVPHLRKRIIRQELQWTDPVTGQRRVSITVTSELCDEDDDVDISTQHGLCHFAFCDAWDTNACSFSSCHWEHVLCGGNFLLCCDSPWFA